MSGLQENQASEQPIPSFRLDVPCTIERRQDQGKEVVFRADAAFAKPEIYEALEKRGVKYAIRIPANDSLGRDIGELLSECP